MKLYAIIPLVGLLVFSGYHWQAVVALRQEAAAEQVALATAHAATLKAEHNAQQQAMTALLDAQEQRKKDRAVRQARLLAEQTARQAALDRLDNARRRAAELAGQLDRDQQQIAAEKKTMTTLEAEKQADVEEQDYLRDFNAQAEANLKALTATLEKLAAPKSSAPTGGANLPTAP